ncbi:ACT domain-containing protein [Clostridium vitabionis]|jgi:ACT domain-containing protein|uniref:ACT domain-containing protein n=1 Tax=Clostridium vitabionis TaxID=2784388 RepID=UPI00188C6955|nr:ACT domain-containing protein [Clostridium vitabionis]
MSKIIVTIVGKDQVGIVAKVCNYLADKNINILDITQTILQGYFNMMMIVDVSGMTGSFDAMQQEMADLGNSMGLRIQCQREEIFESMHRL